MMTTSSSPTIINIGNDSDAISASLLEHSDSSADATATTNVFKSILFFWAEWHAPSGPGGAFDRVFCTLAERSAHESSKHSVKFYRVQAEEASELSRKYHVTVVPTFLFLHTDGSILDRIDGGEDVARVTQAYVKFINAVSSPSSLPTNFHNTPSVPTSTLSSFQVSQTCDVGQPSQQTTNTLHKRLEYIVASSPIMLFLKGTPTSPKCGFSRQAVEILNSCNLSFGYFDILQDEQVRQGLKDYSDWPTYPQLYIRGELMGGLDIMKEVMQEDGGLVKQWNLREFVATTQQYSQSQENHTRLEQLIRRHRIMLFMKGIPSAPRCGFSRQIVDILDSYHVSYDAFNILEDEQVRQELKEYSDWPTYPQLYVEGEFIGGLDIVKEMMESGDLEELLTKDGRD